MNLKQMLAETDLLKYVEKKCETLAFIPLDSYEKIRGGYVLHTGKKTYRVKLIRDSYNVQEPYTFTVEERAENGEYKLLPRRKSILSRGKRFPKLPTWVGAALIAEKLEKK